MVRVSGYEKTMPSRHRGIGPKRIKVRPYDRRNRKLRLTDGYVAERIEDPDEFKKLRTVKSDEHRITVGRYKGDKDDGKTHVQRVLHPKEEYSEAQLKKIKED